jgi:hypothetical protein
MHVHATIPVIFLHPFGCIIAMENCEAGNYRKNFEPLKKYLRKKPSKSKQLMPVVVNLQYSIAKNPV